MNAQALDVAGADAWCLLGQERQGPGPGVFGADVAVLLAGQRGAHVGGARDDTGARVQSHTRPPEPLTALQAQGVPAVETNGGAGGRHETTPAHHDGHLPLTRPRHHHPRTLDIGGGVREHQPATGDSEGRSPLYPVHERSCSDSGQ